MAKEMEHHHQCRKVNAYYLLFTTRNILISYAKRCSHSTTAFSQISGPDPGFQTYMERTHSGLNKTYETKKPTNVVTSATKEQIVNKEQITPL